MQEIKLTSAYTLVLEQLDRSIRMVVMARGEELVCRKERFKRLAEFLNQENQLLFKGRLRLNKKGETIQVIVKNEILGVCSVEAIEQCLSAAKLSK